MKARHFPLAITLLLAGCGTTIEPTASRTRVTPELRSACHNLYEFEIEQLLLLTNADRQAGWSYADELAVAAYYCTSAPCLRCSTAVVDQVYGR